MLVNILHAVCALKTSEVRRWAPLEGSTVPQQLRAAYLALGHPNSAKTGSKGWVLPIPATYVPDSTSVVVLSYLDADHTTRLEPTEIIVALTHLCAGEHSRWE